MHTCASHVQFITQCSTEEFTVSVSTSSTLRARRLADVCLHFPAINILIQRFVTEKNIGKTLAKVVCLLLNDLTSSPLFVGLKIQLFVAF